MLSRIRFFPPSQALEKYIKFKALFIMLVNQTENRCAKMSVYKYDQERNFSIAYHPTIEYDKNLAKKSRDLVRKELKKIEEHNRNPQEALEALLAYGIGLSQCYFQNLFMHILARKLEKRWVPIVHPQPPEEPASIKISC